MSLTADQILQETARWPHEQLADLVDRLALTLHNEAGPDIEQNWRTEVRQRLAEIESGDVQPVPGEDVSNRVRRLVGR